MPINSLLPDAVILSSWSTTDMYYQAIAGYHRQLAELRRAGGEPIATSLEPFFRLTVLDATLAYL